MFANKSALLKGLNRVALFLVTGALLVTGVTPAQANTSTALFMNFEAADPLKSASGIMANGAFEGASAEVKASTRLSGNSLHFTKTGQPWAGVNLLYTNSTPYKYTDADKKIITLDYWSNDTVPTPVMLKLEITPQGPGGVVKTLQAQPGMNSLSFDMSTGTGWDSNAAYKIVAFFPNFGADDKTYAGAGAIANTRQIYEIDNISINGGTVENLYVPVVTPARTATSTLMTFESGDVLGGAAIGKGFEGAATAIVDAPAGGNGGKVLEITKAGNPWSGVDLVTAPSGVKFLDATRKTVTLNYYSPETVNTPVQFQLVAVDGSKINQAVVAAPGWQRLTFDFSASYIDAKEYEKAVIFPNFVNTGDVPGYVGALAVSPLTGQKYAIDNVAFNGAVTPEITPTVTPGKVATSTLMTFESGDVLGGAAIGKGFEGAATAIVDAPAGGNGGKVLEITKAGNAWSGVDLVTAPSGVKFLDATRKTVTLNYYSPETVNTPVQFQLVAVDGSKINQAVVAAPGWQRLTFDFSASYIDAKEYEKAVIFPNFVNTGDVPGYMGALAVSPLTGQKYAIDNVAFNGAVTPVIRTAPKILVNFESNDTSGFTLTDFGGNNSSVVTDAPADGSVGSTKALKIVTAGQDWAGTTFLTKGAGVSLVSAGNFVVKANIYSPVAGKRLVLKIEDSKADTQFVEKDANSTSVVGWKTYTFDFTVGANLGIDYDRASIFVDFGAGKGAAPWYVDDIAFNGAKGADLGGGTIVTPPFTGNANVRLVGMDDTNSFNRPVDSEFWVSQGWYRSGVSARTKQVPVGSTQTLTYLVTNAADNTPLSGQTVTLVLGKEYSGSNAKVNVGNVAAVGTQNKTVTGVTGADGRVTFSMVNTDDAADAADFPGANLGVDFKGKKLFSQVTAWVTSQTQDSIDMVDFIFFRPESYVPAREATSTLLTFEAGDTRGASVAGESAGTKKEGSFEGSVTSIEDAPAGGNGGKALKIVKSGMPWAGANILSFASGVRVTNAANKTITFNYYSPKADSPLRVEIGPGAVGKTVTVPQGWSKVTIDFTDVATWSATTEYTLAAIFPDFLVDPSATPLEFYVDNFGVNGAKTPDITVPSTVYNARLADWNATNSFDGTRIWGDVGIGQGWFDVHTRYFAKYVAAGSTFELRYKVTNAATGANAPDGTVVTLSLGAAWSSSNAKFSAGNTIVDGVTKWGGNGQEDMATVTATVTNGFATMSLTSNDTVADATANPGSATANPDGRSPRFMQVKIKVDGSNTVTRQDWVNIIATKPSAAPTVTSVTARNARAGQAVDIIGTNLGDALAHSVALLSPATAKLSEVLTPVTVVSVSADRTRMTVLSPELSQKGTFVVTNSGGSANSTAFASSSAVTAKPTISMPASLVREVGSTITLTGNNLGSVSSVTIGEVEAPFTILSATSIVVTVPAEVVSGSKINATNAGGTTTTSKFIYQAAVIETVTTAAKVGETVTISGKALKARSVVFGGNKSAKPVINENGTVTVVVPVGALTGAIKITTSAGVYFTKSFTVTPPAPTVSSFSPAAGKNGVTVVTVRGTSLKGATVTVGSTAVTLLSGANSTSFKFVIPAGATSGKITVTTPGGSVESANTLNIN